mgnify:CR=1 FL=1
MKERKKRRLKKFHFHPATTFLLLTILVIVVSCFLAKLNVQSSYSVINPNTLELETKIVKVKNLLTSDGVKLVIGNAATNLASFSAFINLIVALIGLSVAHASGFIKTFIRKKTLNLNNKIKNLELEIEKTNVLSPVDGYVQEILNFNEGDFIFYIRSPCFRLSLF